MDTVFKIQPVEVRSGEVLQSRCDRVIEVRRRRRTATWDSDLDVRVAWRCAWRCGLEVRLLPWLQRLESSCPSGYGEDPRDAINLFFL